MASGSHVDVNERRLRPIYDCLDNGNNKKAIQEAEKALKKHKDFQCAKVLKALALLRLGRHDESSVILDEIHSQHPTDEATLQVIFFVISQSFFAKNLHSNCFARFIDDFLFTIKGGNSKAFLLKN